LYVKTVWIITLSLGPWMFLQAHASSPVSTFLAGVNFPVSLSFAPDGRIFFTEKDTGSIRIIESNGTLLATPFATVPNLFHDVEAGLLGITLDPAFATNQYVYVYYTYRDVGLYTHGHIVRYTAAGNTGTGALDLFDVVSSAPNTIYHNGGYIKFGPDGKLYAVVGEFHQDQQAQNKSSMTGKMLRMNSDGSVPSDNPFAGSLDYALGIRNGFGFDFDLSRSRLVATMAGLNSDDKVLIIVKGGNYGWPTCVGVCHNSQFIDPVVDLNPVVTPTGIATVAPDTYVFGEYNTGNLVELQLNASGGFVGMSQIDHQSGGIIAVEHGPNNKLYYTTPDTIYTYDLPATPRSNTIDPSLIAFRVGVATVAALVLAYALIRYRHRRNVKTQAIGTFGH